jgi:rod shape-determining protein MreC
MPLWEKQKNFVVLAALLFFHLLLISIQVPKGGERTAFENAVFFVFSPVQRTVVSAARGVASAWQSYTALREVRRENQRLKKDLFDLAQDKRFLEERLQYLEAASEVQASLSRFQASIITARVIGLDAANSYRSVVLDKGSRDGVKTDMPVCDRLGNLVGRTIAPVSAKETAVQLITDAASSVSVITDKDRTVAILSGRSGIYCDLKYVLAKAAGGNVGDELVTTGLDKIYPAGIKVGRVVRVLPPQSIFKVIQVQPYFSFSKLEAVGILPRVSEKDK